MKTFEFQTEATVNKSVILTTNETSILAVPVKVSVNDKHRVDKIPISFINLKKLLVILIFRTSCRYSVYYTKK